MWRTWLEPDVPLGCFEMKCAERTSAEAFEKHLPGKLIAASRGRSWKDLLVQIFSRQHDQETQLTFRTGHCPESRGASRAHLYGPECERARATWWIACIQTTKSHRFA